VPSIDDIYGHAKSTGLVDTPAPSGYDNWLQQIAEGYVSTHGADMLGLADNSTTPQSMDRLVQSLRDNKSMQGIFDQGVKPDQIFNAPLMNSGSFDAGGFGVFGGKPYDQLTDAQKGMVDKGMYSWEYNPTMTGTNGNENGGYYWAQTDKTPKVLGKYGTGAFTEFNPFNKGQWNDSGSIAFDPNYGLVTTQANRSSNGLDDAIYNYAPSAFIAMMTMGAAMPALASTMMKVPQLAMSLSNGGNPLSAILSMASGAAGFQLPPGFSNILPMLLQAAMRQRRGGEPHG
jgi:hypothetical protein